MFSNLWHVVGFLRWSEKQKMTPVVDFQNSDAPNRWLGGSETNSWLHYFEPVVKLDLRDRDPEEFYKFKGRPKEFPVQEYSQIEDYGRVFHQYIQLNRRLRQLTDPWLEALSSYPKVLGVHARGTDMKIAKSHWAPPTLYQLGKSIDMAMGRASFEHIFVASEDEKALRFLSRRYGNRLLTTDSFRTSKKKKLVHFESSIPQYRFFLGAQVIRDTWLLSKCKGLVSGHSNVSEHAQVLSGGNLEINLQIRRPQVDVLGSQRWQIAITNSLRELTSSRFIGPDFRIKDRSFRS